MYAVQFRSQWKKREADLYVQYLISCARGPHCCNAFRQEYNRERRHHEELLTILRHSLHAAPWAWLCVTQAKSGLVCADVTKGYDS